MMHYYDIQIVSSDDSSVNSFVKQNHSPLLIVAEDVESDALTMLIMNKHQAGIKVFGYINNYYSADTHINVCIVFLMAIFFWIFLIIYYYYYSRYTSQWIEVLHAFRS